MGLNLNLLFDNIKEIKMKEGVLDISNKKKLNNLDHLFKDNDAKAGDKNVVSINNSIKNFDGAKNKIKDSYINKVKNISNFKIKEETLSLIDFLYYGFISIMIFEAISLLFMLPITLIFQDNEKLITEIMGAILISPIFVFLSLPIIYYSRKESHTNTKNIKKIKNNEQAIIDNIEYFLPMSKEKLNFITKNNIDLRNYIINNPQLCHSQYSIDKALGKKCAFEDYLDDDIKELFDSTYSFSLELNDVDTSTLNQTLSSEQSNLLPIDESYINMKEFKVTYAIEHGPEKSIIFTHTHEDRFEFESYINSFVENNYNRKCSILSVEEIQ